MIKDVQQKAAVWGTKIDGGIRDYGVSSQHWRLLPPNYSLRTKPQKILVLSGNDAKTAKAANGMCKVVEDLLGNSAAKCEICGFYYPENKTTLQNIVPCATELINRYFIPLIADKDANGNLAKLPFAKACRYMRNVVVVTHCYGSRVMAQIDQQLDEIMRQIGYSAVEAKVIHRQLFVAHHNNSREDLGQNVLNSSNLYRVTQADERNTPDKFAIGSLQHFIATEEMVDDELLLMPISATEHALVIKRISDGVESEHSGGYWIKPYKKMPIAQLEEKAFRAILQEIVNSNYPLEDLDIIEKKVLTDNPEMQDCFNQIKEYGQEFADDYKAEKQRLQKNYRVNKKLLENGQLDDAAVNRLGEKDLFFSDESKKTLFDYSFANGDVSTCRALWQRMRKYLPLGQEDASVKLFWKCKSENHKEQYEKYFRYLQQTLQAENFAMLEALHPEEYKRDKADNYLQASRGYRPDRDR